MTLKRGPKKVENGLVILTKIISFNHNFDKPNEKVMG